MTSSGAGAGQDEARGPIADALDEVVLYLGWPVGSEAATAVLAKAVSKYKESQRVARTWAPPGPEPSDEVVTPPYPSRSNPVVAVLASVAAGELRSGADLRTTLLWLLTTAWMEGHVEGFDRAMAEATTSSSK